MCYNSIEDAILLKDVKQPGTYAEKSFGGCFWKSVIDFF